MPIGNTELHFHFTCMSQENSLGVVWNDQNGLGFWPVPARHVMYLICTAQRTRRDERDTTKAKRQSSRQERRDMTCRERRGAINME